MFSKYADPPFLAPLVYMCMHVLRFKCLCCIACSITLFSRHAKLDVFFAHCLKLAVKYFSKGILSTDTFVDRMQTIESITITEPCDCIWKISHVHLKNVCYSTSIIFYLFFILVNGKHIWAGRKEGNVLFNDALNTFYLRLYGVRHMVKDHSDSERRNPLPPHGLIFPISSKGSFTCTIRVICYTSRGALAEREIAQSVHREGSTRRPIAPHGATIWTVTSQIQERDVAQW